MLIVLLSCVDAALTLTLLEHGAYEVNPFMAPIVGGSALLFTVVWTVRVLAQIQSAPAGNTVTIDFPSGTSYRYVQLSLTANNVQNGAQVSEWQIFG